MDASGCKLQSAYGLLPFAAARKDRTFLLCVDTDGRARSGMNA